MVIAYGVALSMNWEKPLWAAFAVAFTDTRLVGRLVDVRKLEREAPAYQVGVVDTELYDARTQQPFCSARADTFLFLLTPTSERVRAFVEMLIREMSRSKLYGVVGRA